MNRADSVRALGDGAGFAARGGEGLAGEVAFFLEEGICEPLARGLSAGVGPAPSVSRSPRTQPEDGFQPILDWGAGEDKAQLGLQDAHAGADAGLCGL